MQHLRDLPLPALVLLGALALLQLSLQAWGLVDLSRRSVVPGGRKWVWAVVIVLGGVVGAAAYLAVGRGAASDAVLPGGAAASRLEDEAARQRAIDRLYGDPDA
ncbi:MAG: PLDc N-terminal domain-containing protein [Gemmatimonadaceae bacterium]